MEEQGSLFSDDEIEQLETEESKARKLANAIFRDWYVQWYKDENGNPRYTQKESFIAGEIKKSVLKGIDPYQLEWAANILGQESKPINELNLQWSIARVRRIMTAEGAFIEATNEKEYGETL